MQPLKAMAELAATRHIRGRSRKRNSILKPFDIILENLEREPKEDVRDMVRRASERDIFDHIQRIAGAEYIFGKGKQAEVTSYVDLFYDGIINQFHKGDVNRVLQRAKLMRSAYLIYYYNALPQTEKEKTEKEQADENVQTVMDLGE